MGVLAPVFAHTRGVSSDIAGVGGLHVKRWCKQFYQFVLAPHKVVIQRPHSQFGMQ